MRGEGFGTYTLQRRDSNIIFSSIFRFQLLLPNLLLTGHAFFDKIDVDEIRMVANDRIIGLPALIGLP